MISCRLLHQHKLVILSFGARAAAVSPHDLARRICALANLKISLVNASIFAVKEQKVRTLVELPLGRHQSLVRHLALVLQLGSHRKPYYAVSKTLIASSNSFCDVDDDSWETNFTGVADSCFQCNFLRKCRLRHHRYRYCDVDRTSIHAVIKIIIKSPSRTGVIAVVIC